MCQCDADSHDLRHSSRGPDKASSEIVGASIVKDKASENNKPTHSLPLVSLPRKELHRFQSGREEMPGSGKKVKRLVPVEVGPCPQQSRPRARTTIEMLLLFRMSQTEATCAEMASPRSHRKIPILILLIVTKKRVCHQLHVTEKTACDHAPVP